MCPGEGRADIGDCQVEGDAHRAGPRYAFAAWCDEGAGLGYADIERLGVDPDMGAIAIVVEPGFDQAMPGGDACNGAVLVSPGCFHGEVEHQRCEVCAGVEE